MSGDAVNLNGFVIPQVNVSGAAIVEIPAGRPQIDGMGLLRLPKGLKLLSTARFRGISGLGEATPYHRLTELRQRLDTALVDITLTASPSSKSLSVRFAP